MSILLPHLSTDGISNLHRSKNGSDNGMVNGRAKGSETGTGIENEKRMVQTNGSEGDNGTVNANVAVSMNGSASQTEYMSSKKSKDGAESIVCA